MNYNVYDVFYSKCSHHHVSAVIAVIFMQMLLFQEYKGTNMVSCVAVTPYQLKIIIISVKVI